MMNVLSQMKILKNLFLTKFQKNGLIVLVYMYLTSQFEFEYTEQCVSKCHESNKDCEEPLLHGISTENIYILLREEFNINSSFEFETVQ